MSSDLESHPVSGSIFRVVRDQMFIRRAHSWWPGSKPAPLVLELDPASFALGKDPRTQFNGSTVADRVKSRANIEYVQVTSQPVQVEEKKTTKKPADDVARPLLIPGAPKVTRETKNVA